MHARDARGGDKEGPCESGPDGALWIPAEAPLSALNAGRKGAAADDDAAAADDDADDPLAHRKLSFLGFRGSDGAPVFAADVTGAEEEVTAGQPSVLFCSVLFPTTVYAFTRPFLQFVHR